MLYSHHPEAIGIDVDPGFAITTKRFRPFQYAAVVRNPGLTK